MSELLACFTDIVLRKGSKIPIDDVSTSLIAGQSGSILPKIVYLFMHLIDKDIFVEVFKSYLAKRLLNDKSGSMENEQ